MRNRGQSYIHFFYFKAKFYIFHTNFIFTSIKNCIIYNYYIYLNILFSCTLVFFCKNNKNSKIEANSLILKDIL